MRTGRHKLMGLAFIGIISLLAGSTILMQRPQMPKSTDHISMKSQLINHTEARMNAAIAINNHLQLAELTRELVAHADSTTETRRQILQTGLAVVNRIDSSISSGDDNEQEICRAGGNVVTTHTRFPGVRPTVSAEAGIEFDNLKNFGRQMNRRNNERLRMKATSRAILNDLGIFARETYGVAGHDDALALDISASPIKDMFFSAYRNFTLRH